MENIKCDYKMGKLPECAPLALAYVPMQQAATPAYEPDEALSRGTLFPGLDLPFMNIVNKNAMGNTPLAEVMALDFVCNELGLYLDTHRDDAEAFATFQSFLRLSAEARSRYIELYGPITRGDLIYAKSFTWLNNPWPWDYESKED
ncbi:MAG: spore coat protein CotJB [Oscillospiraceae bacterium]